MFATIRHEQPPSVARRKRGTAPPALIQSTPTLTLPDISDVLFDYVPAPEMIDSSILEHLANIWKHLDPNTVKQWTAGTNVNSVSVDLLDGMKQSIVKFAALHGLELSNIEYSLGTGVILTIHVFTDEDYPIFFDEIVAYTTKNAPRLVPLVEKTLLRLGSKVRTWEDILIDAEELLDMQKCELEETSDPATIEFFSNRDDQLKQMKSCVPDGITFKSKNKGKNNGTLTSLRKKLRQPMSSVESRIMEWVDKAICLISTDVTLNCLNEDTCYHTVDFRYAMPILFNRDDEITNYYAESLNSEFENGAFIGAELTYQLTSNSDADYLTELDGLLSDIRILSIFEKVFNPTFMRE